MRIPVLSHPVGITWIVVSFSTMVIGPAHGQATLNTPDPDGILQTIAVNGGQVIDVTNPFFMSLGTNGRACITCHVPSTSWTISPEEVQQRFKKTQGLDPIFRTNDGSNSPLADVSTPASRAAAYSMLLTKGVIRVGLPMPAGAEFVLLDVDDPYGFASAAQLSLFRRPLPSTNLRFLTGVMWDGRESYPPMGTLPILPTNTPAQNAIVIFNDLKHQA
ncbi:MAG: hypothetical protein ACM3U2_09775, partial [Deltaproteobacteria bacterium]